MSSPWERIEEGIYRFQDSCHVYAVEGPEGVVLVNAGTGLAADHLGEIAGSRPVTVLLTHHFRDHTDGAIRLREKGVRVFGPYWDQEYLVDPEQHFRERQHWNSYDNRWDRFSPVRPVPVDGWMMDYETRDIAGLSWEVVPTPGMTNGASSYVVTIDGRRIGFVGEVICGTGKTTRLAPLQYNYNDYTGAWNLYHAVNRLLAAGARRPSTTCTPRSCCWRTTKPTSAPSPRAASSCPTGPTRRKVDRSSSADGCSTPSPRSIRPASGWWDPKAGGARR